MADEKAPYEQLVSAMSSVMRGQRVGLQQQDQKKFTFTSASEIRRFRSLLKSELQCDLDKLGSCLGLSAARVEEVMSAAEGDCEKQIDFVLLAWVETNVEKATLEEALRALYAADDTHTVETVAKELSESGSVQREVMIPKKPSYADSVVMPLPPSQTQFVVGGEEMKLADGFARMTVIPHKSPKRLQSESDVMTPVELPPDVSLQAPEEETQLNSMFRPEEPSSAKDEEREAKTTETSIAMEETSATVTGAVTTTTTTAVVSSSFTAPQMVTAVSDTGFQEKHEMVSGDHKMERMQSNLEDLFKSLKRIESGLENVKSDHQKESIFVRERTDELDSKLKKLEEENVELKKNVVDLQKELEDTKQKLKEALEEAVKLRQNNTDLTNQIKEERARFREEREMMRMENNALQERAATSERQKAELQENVDKQALEWKTQQERYEKELISMKAELALVKKTIEDYKDKNTTDSPSDSSSQQSQQGGETGDWVWKQKLGAGGFGDVFLAERRGSDEVYAAKRITLRDQDSIDRQEDMMTTFVKEMKALKECRHQYLVQYVDRTVETSKSEIYFYIIMEYMARGSLSDVIKRGGKLDELIAKKYTRQLLEGLHYLHRRNIIHRDIKCSNILLHENGDIKLADFGCVKFEKRKMDSGVKMTGTAWWMAPELANQSAEASEKSDVWSVGATVIEMLTGKRPFSEYKEKMTVIFALGIKTISLDKLISGPGFSDEVQEFLRLCITWEPGKRATVNDLLKASFVCS